MTTLSASRALAFAALGILAPSVPAAAAPQISQGTWIEYQSKVCPSVTSCFVDFTSIQTGKTMTARNISCRLSSTGGTTVVVNHLILHGNSRNTYLAAGPASTVGNAKVYHVNTQIFDPFVATQKPRVTFTLNAVTAPTSMTLSCTLSGELKP